MNSLAEISAVENEYQGVNGKPSLGRALEMLLERWNSGARDDETIFRLIFLLWYAVVEPPYLTGLPDITKLDITFERVVEEIGGIENKNPRILFAVGIMADMFPWAIGDEKKWQRLGEMFIERALEIQPEISSESFTSDSAAGDYFRHILSR